MDKSVFISKDKKEVGQLADFLEREKTSLIAHSFLSFKAVDFSITAPYEIVFFGSPRAVACFFDMMPLEGIIIACVGQGTAKAVIDRGCVPEFIGSEADINEVAIQFKTWSEGKTVLFPVSNISLKTVSKLFNENQKVEVVIYQTVTLPDYISPCSVYVFTSPSNVEGFYKLNTLPSTARVISWGKSTAKFLFENGIKSEVLSDSTLDALISLLKE